MCLARPVEVLGHQYRHGKSGCQSAEESAEALNAAGLGSDQHSRPRAMVTIWGIRLHERRLARTADQAADLNIPGDAHAIAARARVSGTRRFAGLTLRACRTSPPHVPRVPVA